MVPEEDKEDASVTLGGAGRCATLAPAGFSLTKSWGTAVSVMKRAKVCLSFVFFFFFFSVKKKSVSAVDKCTDKGIGGCVECKGGYYLAEEGCTKCSEVCKTCSKAGSNCLECSA